MNDDKIDEIVISIAYAAFIMIAVIGLMFLLGGCTSEPTRQFNLDDVQDTDCYNSYGGFFGYCDLNRRHI